MSLIWATRGKTWGFRFLLTGGFRDPLVEYDKVFAGAGDDPELCHRVGEKVALRFPDPLGRKDRAGRVIPHEFVLSGREAEGIDSVEDGRRMIWTRSEIAGTFERVWESSEPST